MILPLPNGGRGEGEGTLETPVRLRPRPFRPSTGSALDGTANSDSGSRSSCACKIRPAVLVGCVSFPLTLALSLREREYRIPRCDESRRSGLAQAQSAVLPLPKGGPG